MGYYIETPASRDKAAQMVDLTGAEQLDAAPSFESVPEDKTLLCVIDSGLFEAVGIIYSSEELAAFTDPTDNRPRTWLLLDTDKVIELQPQVSFLRPEEARR